MVRRSRDRLGKRDQPVGDVNAVRKATLVVEDEPMIAILLDDVLTDLGCRVVGPALSLVQGQTMLETSECDAAIVDLNLNGTLAPALIEASSDRVSPSSWRQATAATRPICRTGAVSWRSLT